MGLHYFTFRLKHELLRRTGFLVRRFPVNPPEIPAPEWNKVINALASWPWQAKNQIEFVPSKLSSAEAEVSQIFSFRLRLFSGVVHSYQGRNDWHRHPETGYVYDKNRHWTKIPDFSAQSGDIKFVWERGRFGHIQTIMRFDLQSGLDHSGWVLEELESFINENPINCGPHYRCSQEISLRVINWLGALSFYRDSLSLTPEQWQKIWNSMYWQVHHVRQNIHFSRIAVRNNHAITETLMLYIFGSLFPEAPDAAEWKSNGKRWFEEEIAYQIYPDGSYLQFSMNYHRVLVQLLTLAIRFAEKSGDQFAATVYLRASASLRFLRFFQDPVTGWLPNYGANDGALFFRFSSSHFRDYRPQLEALDLALGKSFTGLNEDACWFGKSSDGVIQSLLAAEEKPGSYGMQLFSDGGFAGIRTPASVLFFRCGRHKDRPSQADNLHLDLWYEGKNILRDAGTYKYNASPEDIRYFFGTLSHNAIMVDGQDQMKKGPRFVWLNWSQAISLGAVEGEGYITLSGEISAFGQIAPGITHKRSIQAFQDRTEWLVVDELTAAGGREAALLWHPGPDFSPAFCLEVRDANGNVLSPEVINGWYSESYGVKEPAPFLSFRSKAGFFSTRIYKA